MLAQEADYYMDKAINTNYKALLLAINKEDMTLDKALAKMDITQARKGKKYSDATLNEIGAIYGVSAQAINKVISRRGK